ncbi:MAG: nitrite/sulfite reductase [bacterium]|nr:nitrite/sulfite reductase [bacterium]
MKIWEKIDINKESEGFDVWKELDEYEETINKLYREEIHPERFKSYRLLFGTYGVRRHGEGMHMQRIKVPSGFITSEQLSVIADVTERFAGSGHAHLTTRQDIQLHYVKLQDIPTLLRMLTKVGITTREACGNSVRNITASYLTGICPDEAFDVLPYSVFCARYFLRHPLSSSLPRKFKMAFSECEEDHGLSRMHDLGAIAQVRKNGKTELGFKVYVGGGLGAVPMYAEEIADFVPADEFYLLVESILKVFHKYGTEERKFRNKARIKFLIARIGFDNFKNLVLEEFEKMKKVKLSEVSEKLGRYVENFPKPAPTKNGREDGEENQKALKTPSYKTDKSDKLFELFLQRYTIQQKQNEYFGVYVKPPIGNLKPDEIRAIAEICDLYGAGYIKITPSQKVLIPWVKQEFLYDVYLKLRSKGFLGGVNEAMRDIVSCPGAFSCKLGVTHSYNLATYIGELVEDTAGLRIHISGCPNSCGQHHIADIGFYGGSAKVGEKLSPHYIVLIGGNIFKQRKRFAEVIGKVPAINAPYFVKEIINVWKSNRKDGEEFFEMVDRLGTDFFRKILAKYSKVDPNNPDIYREPGISEEFKMEAESRGECAGSLVDLMAINLFDSYRNIYEIEQEDIKLGRWNDVKEKLLDSLLKCSKTYVLLEGIEPQNPDEILDEFVKRILPKNWFCSDWEDIRETYKNIKETDGEEIQKFYPYVKNFVKDAEKAFLRLKPNLKIMECSAKREENVPGE